MADDPHNFREAGLFSKAYRALPSECSHREVARVATVFAVNCERVFQLSATHINIAIHSLFVARFDSQVRHELGMPMGDVPDEDKERYNQAIAAAWGEFYDDRETNEEHWKNIWIAGASIIEKHVEVGNVHLDGLLATLTSMIISSWMCFECAAIDVWKLLVNQSPLPLAANVLKSKPLRGDLPSEEKTLSLGTLSEHKFDLSRSMGDILAEQNKVFLGSMVGIESAYKVAFGKHYDPGIFDIESLKRLEAMRNLYAHRGGIVDKTFVRRMSHVDTIHPLEVGQNFVTSGIEVCDYMDSVVRSISNLIRFADRWFDEHSSGESILSE